MNERPQVLQQNLSAIQARVQSACERCGRDPSSVTLIAVSKTHGVQDIQALYDAGHRDFGENYVQEWQAKQAALPDDIQWHFIGGLQSKKVKHLVGKVAWIHSIDSESQLKQLQSRAAGPSRVLVQVNTGADQGKGGVAPDQVGAFLKTADAYPDVDINGLMTIPPFDDPIEVTRGYFRQLRELAAIDPRLRHLSMGMTSDFEAAIEEGATMVRVGTAIFGARDYA